MDITSSYICPDELITLPDDKEMSVSVLQDLLAEHKNLCVERYKVLHDAYIGNYPILHQADKEKYNPDNRIVVNFAKYIVDTMLGFFIGVPIKVNSQDERVAEYLNLLDQYMLNFWTSTTIRTITTPSYPEFAVSTVRVTRCITTMRVARSPSCT